MSGAPVSPYLVPGFYDRALAEGRHRDIVGGRWDETGRAQMSVLRAAGLRPHHRLLDVGAGSLRLGCRAVTWLDEGNYWATDASRALMMRGRSEELADPGRLPVEHLIEDADFVYPGVPETIDMALAFAVFTHLPPDRLSLALRNAKRSFPGLSAFVLTVFLAAEDQAAAAVRQPDGVVTHPARPPYHLTVMEAENIVVTSGFRAEILPTILPRGQRLIVARP
ncbi:MAG: class I SAM-dependent methyltransferase [Jannaschia sp.]